MLRRYDRCDNLAKFSSPPNTKTTATNLTISRQQIISYHFITVHILHPFGAACHQSIHPSLLLTTQRVLYRTSDRSIRVEVLANHALARKGSADLLADVADGAVLGESAADGTLCIES
jgi:hypothetical protein